MHVQVDRGAMPQADGDQPYLRRPLSGSQEALAKHIAAGTAIAKTYPTDYDAKKKWAAQGTIVDWNQAALHLLEFLFTNDRLLRTYRAIAASPISYHDGGEQMSRRVAFLQTTLDALPALVPTSEGAERLAPAGAGSSSAAGVERWEHRSELVKDPSGEGPPTAPKGDEATVPMKILLHLLSDEGWELVAAVPAYVVERSPMTYTEYYRLFFKRPAR